MSTTTTGKTQCTKFIDINSNHRNRQQYPNPGDFVVAATSTNRCGEVNGVTAEDPVINGYPQHIFQGGLSISNAFQGGTPSKPMLGLLTANVRGALLVDTTINESAYIQFFNTTTGVADIGVGSGGFSNAFSTSDIYSISDPSDGANIYFPGGSILDSAYVGFYLFDITIGENRPIAGYDGDTCMITVDPPFSGSWAVNDLYEIRKDPNVFMNSTTNLITTNTILITSPPSPDLVGKYVRITDLSSPMYNEVRRITAYDVLTSTASVYPVFVGPLPSVANTTFEILYFSYDNSYFINMISNCRLDRGMYEIELRSIIIPNVNILTGYGGRLVSYPYIYIEFGNLSNGVNNILISNNPAATKVLFKVPTYDIQPRVNSNFLKIDRTNMPQVIHFNPYEDYYFKILMPNGEPFLIAPDNFSPLPPNPELQISVTFMVNKIV